VDPQHLLDIALHIWGPDAEAMMQAHSPTDAVLMKYQHCILDHEQVIRGHRVLDVGCNHGLWSYVAHRHGATHVTGLEPRGMFVRGLNSFARQYHLPMQFSRGWDTDVADQIARNQTDTVLLMSVDDITHWEPMMYAIAQSRARWVIMQNTALPDDWCDWSQDLRDFAQAGAGMPVGFTLHYPAHNSSTRRGIHPAHRESVDPDTGYPRLADTAQPDSQRVDTINNFRSRAYVRHFLEHAGFEVVSSQIQTIRPSQTASRSAQHGLYHWQLLRNKK
jgi:hypothetical protein